MSIRTRGHSYMADFMVSGVRYRETFDTRREAEGWEVDVRHALKTGREVPSAKNGKSETGSDLRFLDALVTAVSRACWAGTRGGHVQITVAKQMVKFLGPKKLVSEITKADLEDLYLHFIDSGNQPTTANRKMASVTKLLNEAIEYGVIDRAPKAVKRKVGDYEIRFLTEEEEDRLLGSTLKMGLDDWHGFIAFAIDTGCRLSEMLKLKWHHFGPELEKVHIWDTKSGKARTIPLTSRAKAVIAELQETLGDRYSGPWSSWTAQDGKNLQHPRRRHWAILTSATNIHKRIHDLRHTCASRLVQRGVDLLRVKQWMGHSKIETTLIYAHLAPNDLDVCREALESRDNTCNVL